MTNERCVKPAATAINMIQRIHQPDGLITKIQLGGQG